MKKFILLSIFILSAIFAQAGGGWVQEKSGAYFKIGQNAIVADNFFNLNGEIIDITTISLYTTSLYGEYGLSDKLTAIAYIPFFVRSTLNKVERRQSGKIEPGDEINSFGDTDLGLKYSLISNSDIALSATLIFGLPFGQTAGGQTENGDARILQTGDGEFNQLIMLEASHSFYPKPVYISAGVGFNNRTQNFSDEIRFSFELGYSFNEHFNTALKVYAVHSLMNGNPGGGAGNGVFGNNVEYISVTPEIAYTFKSDFGLSASIGLAPYAANLLAAPNYGIGVFKVL